MVEKPLVLWSWWMMLLKMSWRGCVGTDTCKTHIIYFTVAYWLLSWIFNRKFFSWQDVWTKNTWNKTWQEVLWISFWQKHKLQHLQWRVSILVYPQCTKNYEYVFFNSSVGSKEIKILFKPEGTSDRELRSYIEPAQPCRDHRRFARSE